jgi:hypothetical protein
MSARVQLQRKTISVRESEGACCQDELISEVPVDVKESV